MLHSYTRIIVHLIWSTKGSEKIIPKNVRPRIEHHIKSYAKDNSILLDTIKVQV